MSTQQSIFFLGATGYLGSEFLAILNKELPHLHVTALLRNATPERKMWLQAVYPHSSVIEGTLDDDATITEQAAKADIVINCASSDHLPSVISTLAGLETKSTNNSGKPPLYIHVSGCGIVSDNARGDHVDFVKEWTDIGLNLLLCDRKNMHLDSDILIVEAGSRKEIPIRTIIYYPAQIYGVSQGIQKTTLWLRVFLDFAKKLGHAGTWGPGANSMNNIHVRDCANGLFLILKAALEGRADEGPEGLYFSASMEPRISYYAWTKVMGDYLYRKNIVKEPGSRPMPLEVVDLLGEYGWSLLGGNQFVNPQRLAKLGWEPVETKKTSLLKSLPDMIDVALQEEKQA